jgi:hypothetical protein
MRGISSVLREAPYASLHCSMALRSDEFFQLIEASRRVVTTWPGASEFASILRILEARAPAGTRPGAIGPSWTMCDQRVWQSAASRLPKAEIFSLSPSPSSITLAVRAFERLLPTVGPARKIVAPPTPNQAAVAISVTVGSVSALLGADLEASGDPTRGWQAIINSSGRPRETAHIFKVPHHGSANADDPQVWDTLLVPNPRAALTPFTRGATPLPRLADVGRLKTRTDEAYATGRPAGWAPARRDAAVARTLKEMNVRLRALSGPMGHVRIRSDSRDPTRMRVEVSNGAYKL